jgi:hypothetical protein
VLPDFFTQDLPIAHDFFTIGNQTVVSFSCAGKNKTVRSPLSGSFNLSVQSQWNGLFEGAGGSTLLGIVNGVLKAATSRSVTQPWFGRKAWGGTTPLKFSLPLRFISRFNAYKEVYLPVTGLLSFMYPRLDDENAAGDTASVLSTYFIPGPNLFYTKGGGENLFGLGGAEGDRVEITIGQFMSFSGCYLTSINLNVENSFNVEGWPHNVAAQVEFEAMDVSFVNFDGGFMQDGFKDQSFVMNDWLKGAMEKADDDSAGSAMTQLKDMISGVGKFLAGIGS